MSRVMIVDDESELCETLSELLQSLYPEVECHTSYAGEEAFSKLQNQTYQLLITDMKMPGMDGLELIKKVVSEIDPKPHIFAMSGFSEVVREEAIAAGAVNLFQKPGDLQLMIKQVSEYIG